MGYQATRIDISQVRATAIQLAGHPDVPIRTGFWMNGGSLSSPE
jgi:hypothetical protein